MSNLTPGTEIYKNTMPFVHCLLKEYKSFYCDNCFANKPVARCSACKYMHYCSQKCQRVDWPIHKHECGPFKERHTSKVPSNDLTRLLIRALLKSKLSSDMANLCDHYNEIIKDLSRMKNFYQILDEIKSVMSEDFIRNFMMKDLISIYGKLLINSLSITNEDMSISLGSGLYLGISSIDHSCYPNCVVVFDGVEASVKVIRRPLELGEKPLISYIDVLARRADRQKLLNDNYYFRCMCSKCTEPVIDSNELSGLYLEKVQYQIDKTEVLMSEEKVKNIKKLLSEYSGFWKSRSVSDMSIVFKMGEILMDHFIKVGTNSSNNEALGIAMDYLLDGYTTHFPEYHPSKGFLFYKISSIAQDMETARHFFKKAYDCFRVSHPEGHTLLKKILASF